MKLWIDDVRPAPEDYIWIKSTNQFLRLFNSAVANSADPLDIEEISIDHDAGNFADDGEDYINILDQLENFYHTIFILPFHELKTFHPKSLRQLYHNKS